MQWWATDGMWLEPQMDADTRRWIDTCTENSGKRPLRGGYCILVILRPALDGHDADCDLRLSAVS